MCMSGRTACLSLWGGPRCCCFRAGHAAPYAAQHLSCLQPADMSGHGSHTAGSVGAAGNNLLGVTGVAWTINLYICKTEAADGGLYTSSIISCYALCGSQVRGSGVVPLRGQGSEAAAAAVDGLGGSTRQQTQCPQIRARVRVVIDLRSLLPSLCAS